MKPSPLVLTLLLFAACGPGGGGSPDASVTSIKGMSPDDIRMNLTKREFKCGDAPATMQPADKALKAFECLSADRAFVYSVVYITEGPGVRLMTASVTSAGGLTGDDVRQGAGLFLGFVATMPYSDASPTEAQEWVKANVGQGGSTKTIGTAQFEIDPDSGKGSPPSFRLNMIAIGAIPKK